jgi:pimeloyl-ACP methyl ester carboxylesterase
VRLLFLHALPLDGRMWSADLERFGDRAVAPDLYGLGDSLGAMAAGALAAAGADPVVVVGCSMGGSCALQIARLAPEQVLGIVLVGAKAGVRPEPSVRDEAIVELRSTGGIDAAWSHWWAPLFGPRTSAAIVSAARSIACAQPVEALVRGVRAFHDRDDLTDVAATWTRPLVVVSGEHDRSPPPATTRPLGTGTRRRFHLVEASGHYVNLEQPDLWRHILDDSIAWITSHHDVTSV